MIATVVLCLLLPCIPAAIASGKGRCFVGWYLMGLVLPFGFIILTVAALAISRPAAPVVVYVSAPPAPAVVQLTPPV